jgi:type I restriction enzyme S subunit
MTPPTGGWPEARLGSLATLDREVVAPERIPTGMRYVGLEHIDSDGGLAAAGTVDAGDLRSAKFTFTSRHILYGKLRPYLRKVARPAFSGVCSTDILPILPGPDIERDFLFHCLRLPRLVSLATARSEGANLPRLAPKTLLEFPIPAPPLAEQRRIAAMLDKADAIRRKRRESLWLLDEFLRSAFLEMFGDPVRNEKGWEAASAGEIFAELRYGTSVKCSTERVASALPVLRIPNVIDGAVSWDDLKFAQIDADEVRRLLLSEGDLLFVRTNGNPHYIGRCAVFGGSRPTLFASYLIRGRLREEAEYRPAFIKHVVSFPSYRSRLVAQTRTTAGNYNISAEGLRRLSMIHPPLELQDRFLVVDASVRKQHERLDRSLAECEQLFDSLAQQAFAEEP